MTRPIFSVILFAILFTTGAVLTAQTPDAKSQNARLGRGVNIIGYDRKLWKDHTQGRFKEGYFRMLKDAGFTSVRIVLHPFSHMDGAHRIDSAWFSTLDWAVAKAREAGLAMVLDMHEYNAMADDPIAKKDTYLDVWRQLAPRYKDQPDDVMFELLNEPNRKLSPELWNGLLLEAVAVVRESNPTRTLIIGPGNWNGIETLPSLRLPAEDRNIIVTVHFYHPMRFTHQGAPWTPEYRGLTGITWTAAPDERTEVDTMLQAAAAWGRTNNRPIFLGEFGAYDKGESASRARYTDYVARKAEALEMSWAYWQFDSDFLLYHIDEERWETPILKALTGMELK